MNCIDEIFIKAFINALVEQGLSYQVDSDNIYSIAPKNKHDQVRTAKLIGSTPIQKSKHGSKNNTEIHAIGYFRFILSPKGIEAKYYIFAFNSAVDNKVEFVIVPTAELRKRLESRKCNKDIYQETELKFWLLPDGYIFDTTNFGAEGEWWFLAGRMAKNTIWDYTSFRNRWIC